MMPRTGIVAGAWPGVQQPDTVAGRAASAPDLGGIITEELSNSSTWETPFGTVRLPRFDPIHVGAVDVDLSITRHVLFIFFAAVLVLVVLLYAASRLRRGGTGAPRGVPAVVEAVMLFIRDEIVARNIGPDGRRYLPFIATLFWFILFANLLGLVPWGTTPTSSLSVTAALALLSFVVIEGAGMRALGFRGYLGTIFYAPPGMNRVGRTLMLLIMTPVEFLGKLAKPFALAVRLFANMTAGHLVVLSLIGLLLLARPLGLASLAVIPGPIVMAVAILLLEVFVAFLQAYIFAVLTAVFIGLITSAHH